MKTAKSIEPDNYKGVNYTLFLEPASGHWFYLFQYKWTNYRPNRGFKSLGTAIEAAHAHIDKVQ